MKTPIRKRRCLTQCALWRRAWHLTRPLLGVALWLTSGAELSAQTSCDQRSAREEKPSRSLSLSARVLTFTADDELGETLTLEGARLAPCQGLEAWLSISGARVQVSERAVYIEQPRLILGDSMSLPLPTLTLDAESPWRWLKLPKVGWSDGQLGARVPLSFPLGARGSVSPSVGWWGGWLADLELDLAEGEVELLWSQARGALFEAQLTRSASATSGLNLWLLGRWASEPLSASPGALEGWAERAVLERDVLWGGASRSLWTGADLRLALGQLSPLVGPSQSLAHAQLQWATPDERAQYQLALSGLLRRDVRDAQRSTVAGRYERAEWLGVARLRGSAELRASLAADERVASSAQSGWAWLTLGIGSRGEAEGEGSLRTLELELRAELIHSAQSATLPASSSREPLTLNWSQSQLRSPELGRVGLHLEWRWAPTEVRASPYVARGFLLSVWGGLTQRRVRWLNEAVAISPVGVSSLRWSGLTLGMPVLINGALGMYAQGGRVEEWGEGELSVGRRWQVSGRLMMGEAPLTMWGVARVGADVGLREGRRAPSEPLGGASLSYQGEALSLSVSLWSARVASMMTRWEPRCGCWGLSAGVAWSERLGEQLGLSLDLGRGG